MHACSGICNACLQSHNVRAFAHQILLLFQTHIQCGGYKRRAKLVKQEKSTYIGF